MPWVRIDDHFDEHPKHALAGPLCWALWLAGLAYCNRNLTDGFIPWAVARTLVSWNYLDPPDEDGPNKGRNRLVTVSVTCGMSGNDVTSEMVINRLIYAGLWQECDGGYKIHDYPDYQPSRKEIISQRKHNAERQHRHRSRNAVTNDEDNVASNTSYNANVTAPPYPFPIPFRKEKKQKLLSGSQKPDATQLLAYLNEQTGHHYRSAKPNLALITSCLASGATAEQVRAVIDAKVAEWKADPKMRQYLRPSTLFRASNFEQYLGQVQNGQGGEEAPPGGLGTRGEDFFICGCPRTAEVAAAVGEPFRPCPHAAAKAEVP